MHKPKTWPPERQDVKPPSFAAIGALIGDPVRASILLQLTDGSQRPASELAALAGASPQAASAHLAQLVDGGLLAVSIQGRHRFFAIASGEVAEMIEGLANWADPAPTRRPHDPALCRARLCYDHLAGQLGVAIFERMAAQGWLVFGRDGPELNDAGLEWCRAHGIETTPPPRSRRPRLRLCLDWTERRHHLGGHFGAAFTRYLHDQGFVCQRTTSRIIDVTPRGSAFLRRALSIDLEV